MTKFLWFARHVWCIEASNVCCANLTCLLQSLQVFRLLFNCQITVCGIFGPKYHFSVPIKLLVSDWIISQGVAQSACLGMGKPVLDWRSMALPLGDLTPTPIFRFPQEFIPHCVLCIGLHPIDVCLTHFTLLVNASIIFGFLKLFYWTHSRVNIILRSEKHWLF